MKEQEGVLEIKNQDIKQGNLLRAVYKAPIKCE
jgi:hypothetical protein